jgi:hypothetical protein
MSTQLHSGIQCPICGNETNRHRVGCTYESRLMLEAKDFVAPVLVPTTGRAFDAQVERFYSDALKQFGPALAKQDRRPLVLHFRSDVRNPGATESYRWRDRLNVGSPVMIDLVVPPEIVEPDVRDTVKFYLRDGFIFKGVTP